MSWLNSFKRSNDLNIDRPFTWPEMTPQDWLLEAFSVIGLVSMFVYVLYYFPRLPQAIPVHFDQYGSSQDVGSRMTIWIIPAITLLIHFLLPYGERYRRIQRGQRFSRRVYTQNQFTQRIRLLRYNKMVITWGLFYISVSTVKVSLHSGGGVGIWFAPVFLAALILPMLYFRLFIK